MRPEPALTLGQLLYKDLLLASKKRWLGVARWWSEISHNIYDLDINDTDQLPPTLLSVLFSS